MALRTFYWDPLAQSASTNRPSTWRVGNAGDLLNKMIPEAIYDRPTVNVADGSGRRLLLVGSVAHRIEPGDLVYGVGTKGSAIPGPADAECRVIGTRGPITTEAFREAGHDLGEHGFELDPGLLIARFLDQRAEPEKGRVIFIPHYRDRRRRWERWRRPATVSVDADPLDLAQEICRSEFVYTSSLHGLIFAHALGRPAQLVAPGTPEPLVKYQDYFASVGLPWSPLPTLQDCDRRRRADSPVTLPAELDSLTLPGLDVLQAAGITD